MDRTGNDWSGSTTPIRSGGRGAGEPHDHRHRERNVKEYQYRDAATLLSDFWEAVDAVLRERGVIP
jgi:hypothetical protein